MNIECFKPIVDQESSILILGSMPGKISLEKSEYYGNRQNKFWTIMFDMFDCEYSDVYSDKIELLRQRNIALWDVIKHCERKSSLDSDIRNATINDFSNFFSKYNKIKYVYLNGSKAYQLFTKKVNQEVLDNLNVVKLDSTSPARAIKYEIKLKNWLAVKESYELLKK